jgi:hypothetical protein
VEPMAIRLHHCLMQGAYLYMGVCVWWWWWWWWWWWGVGWGVGGGGGWGGGVARTGVD